MIFETGYYTISNLLKLFAKTRKSKLSVYDYGVPIEPPIYKIYYLGSIIEWERYYQIALESEDEKIILEENELIKEAIETYLNGKSSKDDKEKEIIVYE